MPEEELSLFLDPAGRPRLGCCWWTEELVTLVAGLLADKEDGFIESGAADSAGAEVAEIIQIHGTN